MRKLIPTFLLLALAACPQAPATPPTPDVGTDAVAPTPPPPAEAAPAPPAPTDTCGAGEAKLLALGCTDPRGRLIGGPNMHDAGWADTCRFDLDAGVDLHASCIAAAATCAAVMLCR
jgi:hypothetical protein